MKKEENQYFQCNYHGPVELGESLPPGHSKEGWFSKEKNSWLQVTGGDQSCAPARQFHLLEQLLLHLARPLQLLTV